MLGSVKVPLGPKRDPLCQLDPGFVASLVLHTCALGLPLGVAALSGLWEGAARPEVGSALRA